MKALLFACLIVFAFSARRAHHSEEVHYHDAVAGPTTANPWSGSPTGSNPWAGAPTGNNPWATPGSQPAGANPWSGQTGSPTGVNPWATRPGTPTTLNPWNTNPTVPGGVNPWNRPTVPTGNWGPNSAVRPGTFRPASGVNYDDFMMRLSGSGLNCPGVRVSVNRGFGRQEYKYEGPIQLSCVVGTRTIQQGTCYNYRECSQLICRFTTCKNQGGRVLKRKL